MTNNKYRITKYACYATNVAMAMVYCLSPILFTTFKEMYGLSYTQIGTLILVNPLAQLFVDLIFSFFSKKFNIPFTVKITPLITVFGIIIYAVMPLNFPDYAYFWLIIGTIIFAISSGLAEVLMSPTIAAIPSDNSEREMSILHSLYAWGVVAVVIFGAVFIKLFGTRKWYILVLLCGIVPIIAFILYMFSEIPPINSTENHNKKDNMSKITIMLFVACIFFGGAVENTMTQWCSSYIEKALSVSKFWADLLGLALFAFALGTGRTLYAKFGKNITNILLLGFSGALICYLVVGLITIPVIGLIACVFTGFCVSMLWPGTLIMTGNKYANCGVVVYALLAGGGDFGGAVAPQIMGIIADKIGVSRFADKLSLKTGISAEQIGLRAGMVFSCIFAIFGIITILIIKKRDKKEKQR